MSPSKLSNDETPPDLDSRFTDIKQRLIKSENVKQVTASWKRLLVEINKEFTEIAKIGPSYVPKCDFIDIKDNKLPQQVSELFKQRGCLMIENVIVLIELIFGSMNWSSFVKHTPKQQDTLFLIQHLGTMFFGQSHKQKQGSILI